MEETFLASTREYRALLRMGSMFFGMGILGLCYAVTGEHRIAEAYWILSPPLFLIGALLLFMGVRLPRHAISMDNDGIWRTRLGRERGLIRWEDVHEAVEHHVRHRLDLLDARGRTLIRIHGCIEEFDRVSRKVQGRIQG